MVILHSDVTLAHRCKGLCSGVARQYVLAGDTCDEEHSSEPTAPRHSISRPCLINLQLSDVSPSGESCQSLFEESVSNRRAARKHSSSQITVLAAQSARQSVSAASSAAPAPQTALAAAPSCKGAPPHNRAVSQHKVLTPATNPLREYNPSTLSTVLVSSHVPANSPTDGARVAVAANSVCSSNGCAHKAAHPAHQHAATAQPRGPTHADV
ncbi:hypothetical protein HW555_011946 [Spodoptera exigua]|uniref:Uncharacterized protein n=1 Tax=Spodoptera exigua TaxID=7107 RepID=A0A835L440_SPOEX|nr:hypothetical protein HW555_011946 [Spodoptera exigua]